MMSSHPLTALPLTKRFQVHVDSEIQGDTDFQNTSSGSVGGRRLMTSLSRGTEASAFALPDMASTVLYV